MLSLNMFFRINLYFFRLALQKNLSSQTSRLSASYINGKIRVRILMQFRASRSGAMSASGKEGCRRKIQRRDVITRISVSRFSGALSRVRRISAEENRLNTSSGESGSSQNYHDQSKTADDQQKALRKSNKNRQQEYSSLLKV